MSRTPQVTSGDCEFCQRVEVELFSQHGDLMCAECIALEAVVSQAKQTIPNSRKVDSTLELKQDLFNAGTVSFIELQAAIENNPEIPADKKNYALVSEIDVRIQKLDEVIFAEEAALIAKKNERHALLINAQNLAAKLHDEERAKFRRYDVTYKPVTPKSPKSPKPVTGKSFEKKLIKEAAEKYKVPMSGVQSIVVSRNGITPDAAAKELAKILGLL